MRRSKIRNSKKKSTRHATAVAPLSLGLTAPEISAEELQRRASVEEIFEQIDVLRRRTKRIKGLTIEMMISEGRE